MDDWWPVRRRTSRAETFALELLDLALTVSTPLLLWLGTLLILGGVIGVTALPVEMLVAFVWLAFLLGIVVEMTTERFARGNWRRGLALHGRARWPFLGVIASLASVLLIAWSTFAGFTCVLRDLGWVHLSPDFSSAECLVRLHGHYAWHFLDAIPGFDIPKTLHWTAPYTYSDTLTGALILAYKAAIVLPLIGGYRLWRRIVTEEKGPRLDVRTRLRRLFA